MTIATDAQGINYGRLFVECWWEWSFFTLIWYSRDEKIRLDFKLAGCSWSLERCLVRSLIIGDMMLSGEIMCVLCLLTVGSCFDQAMYWYVE